MGLLAHTYLAFRVSAWREFDRRRLRVTRTAWASLSPRRIADHLRSYFSTRLEAHPTEMPSAALRADIVSYLFFILLVGITFLL